VHHGRAFLLVYDVTSRESLEAIPAFRERILIIREDDVPPMVLVGNKIDLESDRKVSTEEGKKFAEENGMGFIETSALSGQNCEEAFAATVRVIREREAAVNHAQPRIGSPAKKSKWWCCIL
jgi:GTPase KRas